MRAAVVLLAVLLAGCSGPIAGPAEAPTPEASGGSNGAASHTGAASPGANASMAPVATTQWYLHKEKTCEGGTADFCNCGSMRPYMVMDATKGACDGGGSRQGVPGASTDATVFSADQAMPAYPVGSRVAGTVYLTDDAVDTLSLHVELRVNGTAVGSADVPAQPVVGLGGGQAAPFPFSFLTSVAVVPPKNLHDVTFVVQVHANESWFLDSAQTSTFTIGPDHA